MSFKAILLVFGFCCVVRSTNSERVCKTPLSALPPEPASNCCGIKAVTAENLMAGTSTSIYEYPWVVLIEYLKDNIAKTPCHGVLISGQYVLTVGHCVTTVSIGTPSNIILGEYDTTHEGPDCESVSSGGEDCTEGAIKIPIEAIILHPDFNKTPTPTNDIALIKMKSAAPYTDFIRPVCLPTEDLSQKTGVTRLRESGWGGIKQDQRNNTKKQVVNLPFVSRDKCAVAFKNKFQLEKSHLCAGGLGVKAFCKASSGSPLMYQKNKYEIVGLSSFGTYPCDFAIPAVYTNVYEYVSWIKNTISA